MKKLSLILAIVFITVSVLAGSAFAVKKVLVIENGQQSASSSVTDTSDGLQICSKTTPTQCLIVNPKSLPTGTANLLAPWSVTASATGLTSAITGTVGAALTSGPTLTITQPGTYMLSSSVSTTLAAATFTNFEAVTCQLYRTNNTPGAITSTLSTALTPSVTASSTGGPTISTPVIAYTTANSNDAIQVYCAISADPGAGAINATEVNMLGVRFK